MAHQPVADQRYDEHNRIRQVDQRLERGRAEHAFDLRVTGYPACDIGRVPLRSGHSASGIPRCGRRLAVVVSHGAAVLSATGHLQKHGDALIILYSRC